MKVTSIVVCCIALLTLASAHAEPAKLRRLAIVVGNDRGARTDAQLHYAQHDATELAQVLRQLGGVSARDLELLLDADASAVRAAFARVEAEATREPIALVFYYSGHADGDALHLGDTTLPWKELDGLVRHSGAVLRIAFADACQSGMLVTPKGLRPGPVANPAESHGTAILVATTSVEAALESENLGGSFFTHYLVSGLRGAADTNGDLQVTLSEAHAYAARETQNATSGWSTAAQHPMYDVELSGQREVVLTDLREADARISFAASLAGDIVVSTTGSDRIVAELAKSAGAAATIALPSGRYRVYVRGDDSVLVGDVSLPWGGNQGVTRGDLVRRSYYEVTQKGARLEQYASRLRLGAGLGYSTIDGVGVVAPVRLGFGVKVGAIEWGVRAGWMRDEVTAVDTAVHSTVLSAALVPCFERIFSRIDLRSCGIAELQWWRQAVDRAGVRSSAVPGIGASIGLRLPLSARTFAEPDVTFEVDLPTLADGVAARPRFETGLALGALF